MIRMAGVALIALMAAGNVAAQDRTGYQAIAAGDLSVAAQRIEAERRIFPERPELMLNLAAVYASSGRVADARTLYATVLDRTVVMMDMPNGAVRSSHEVAATGIARLSQQVASTR